MKIFTEIKEIRDFCRSAQQSGKLAFVPTMGNLHRGHLSLVESAQQSCDAVAVSIYVNPLQFGPNEDYQSYPRTLEADLALLENMGVDAVFTPSDSLLYPHGQLERSFVEVPGLSNILEGACRPGHFRGVSTVVCKLFNIVQPDLAVFGEKDFQQLMVIRRMVEDLNLPVQIEGMPTLREEDGLAMSSRNQYLSLQERQQAAGLYAVLQEVRQGLLEGAEESVLQQQALDQLQQAGFEAEYLEIRDAQTLQETTEQSTEKVVLAAARLGRTRLIDNLRV